MPRRRKTVARNRGGDSPDSSWQNDLRRLQREFEKISQTHAPVHRWGIFSPPAQQSLAAVLPKLDTVVGQLIPGTPLFGERLHLSTRGLAVSGYFLHQQERQGDWQSTVRHVDALAQKTREFLDSLPNDVLQKRLPELLPKRIGDDWWNCVFYLAWRRPTALFQAKKNGIGQTPQGQFVTVEEGAFGDSRITLSWPFPGCWFCTLSCDVCRASARALDRICPKPRWDENTRSLFVDDKLIKAFRRHPAKNQIDLIEAFEKEGWPPSIPDPFKDSRKLNETIRQLNKSAVGAVLSFTGDGSGKAVNWQFVEQR